VAVWQFTIELLPQQWLEAGGAVDTLYGIESYDTSATWETGDVASIQQQIGSILSPVESWSESRVHWGDYETDDITLFADNGHVQGLCVRFDMRRPNLPLFGHVVSAASPIARTQP